MEYLSANLNKFILRWGKPNPYSFRTMSLSFGNARKRDRKTEINIWMPCSFLHLSGGNSFQAGSSQWNSNSAWPPKIVQTENIILRWHTTFAPYFRGGLSFKRFKEKWRLVNAATRSWLCELPVNYVAGQHNLQCRYRVSSGLSWKKTSTNLRLKWFMGNIL